MTSAADIRRQHSRQKGECTWCGARVKPPRQTWCGQECVAAYKRAHDWQYIRSEVAKRDRGVCALCGTDTEKIARILRHIYRDYRRDNWQETRDLMRQLLGCTGWRDPWEADHIVPRCRGGNNALDNLRTLCIPCHKRETKRLARERAQERRQLREGATA